MSIMKLYPGIANYLAQDADLLSLIGLFPDSDPTLVAQKIQKQCHPQNPTVNVPLITFYAYPGVVHRDVYTAPISFDIYTNQDVDTALQIAERIQTLFNGEIPPLPDVEIFEARLVSAHETVTQPDGLYSFSVMLSFSITDLDTMR